jgi:hypothetical protein
MEQTQINPGSDALEPLESPTPKPLRSLVPDCTFPLLSANFGAAALPDP